MPAAISDKYFDDSGTKKVIARSANGMTANHENGNHTVTDELVRKNPANRYTIPSNANSIRK
ncbi:MAG: hypothetical protein R2847_10665 [Bacteroidia bacterium]